MQCQSNPMSAYQFSQEVTRDALLQQASQGRFFKVAATAWGPPFMFTKRAGAKCNWLGHALLSRRSVVQMLARMKDADVWDYRGDAPARVSDDQLRHIARVLSRHWHATCIGSQHRGLKSLARPTETPWVRRRGWDSRVSPGICDDAVYAWQMKLLRLTARASDATTRDASPSAGQLREFYQATLPVLAALNELRRTRRGGLNPLDVVLAEGMFDDAWSALRTDAASRSNRQKARQLRLDANGGKAGNKQWQLASTVQSDGGRTVTFTFKQAGAVADDGEVGEDPWDTDDEFGEEVHV